MGEVVYEYDHKQDLSSNPDLILSCICSEDSFSYAIETEGSNTLVAARVLAFDTKYPGFSKPLGYLPEVIREDTLLFEPFVNKCIALRGIPFRRVDHVSGNGRAQLATTTALGPNDAIIRERLPGQWGTLLSSIPTMMVEELKYYFMNASIRHAISGLILHAAKNARQKGEHVFVNLGCTWFEVVIVRDGSLAFANHFKWQEVDDVLYYLLAISEAFEFEMTSLQFTGAKATTDNVEYLYDVLTAEHERQPTSHSQRLLDLISLAECA